MANTEKLASAALGDKEAEKEVIVTTVLVPFERGVTRLTYPVNRTDQLHGLSVAEMVRNGQGSVPIDDVSNYDYIDERNKPFKDDGSLEVHSMNEIEWADPAEIYERSQALEREIQNSVKVTVKADKLASDDGSIVSSSSQKTSESENHSTENN